MAEGNTGGGNSGLAFVVGGLLVLVVVIGAFLIFGGGLTQKKEVDVNIKAPDIQAPKLPSGG
ncbi:hypothetical protein [Caulobacter sp. NIBR1757]|uniref:hypothetical protein n=1 Tax=Caulobacter sp. NIBR1757 TaxID=3016000 RepID=UPI0022F0B56D|nr:hypothetical protein [Caulobacter sp. NIBR1757]WGM40583.1 hypothetical protein AMEJIAPC_03528 [Caulobacter sp. NIBR1757]